MVVTRTHTIGWMAVTALAVCGCGGSSKYANQARPAVPINLTVIINKSGVSVSPAAVGGGQAVFTVTNQSPQAEGLAIESSSSGQQVAATAPINPQGTAQVAVNLSAHAHYRLTATTNGSTNSSLTAASVAVGADRQTSRNVLMTP